MLTRHVRGSTCLVMTMKVDKRDRREMGKKIKRMMVRKETKVTITLQQILHDNNALFAVYVLLFSGNGFYVQLLGV